MPILVWIHGGGWTAGAGSDYDGGALAASQNIMVVTINYRLGVLGWYALSDELAAEPGSENATGGMNGVRDQIAARADRARRRASASVCNQYGIESPWPSR